MKNLHKTIGIFSASLLLAVTAFYIYSPISGTNADTTGQMHMSLDINSNISISTSENELELDATVGSFVNDSIDVYISTNSEYGYTLTLEDLDSSTNMVNTNPSVDSVVTSEFAGSKNSTTMADNTWGFSLDQTDFFRVPVNGNPVALKRTNGVTADSYETVPVGFGAKVGMGLTAGTYEDVVLFTAYVNGVSGQPADGTIISNNNGPDVRTISDITSMQQMTSKFCENTSLHQTATLTDIRDGNRYTVIKAKDGNCWMTQNLRLIDYTLTSADSDVPEGFSFHVPTFETSEYHVGSGSQDEFKSPAAAYNEQYGGYYNYHTAVGGWWGEGIDQDVNSPQSICPKGWRIPTGTYGGEFEMLYRAYNMNYQLNAIALTAPPLNFVANGYYIFNGPNHESNGFYEGGVTGNYWSASGYSGYSYAQYLWINANIQYGQVNPNGYASPSYLYGVRCVAR